MRSTHRHHIGAALELATAIPVSSNVAFDIANNASFRARCSTGPPSRPQ